MSLWEGASTRRAAEKDALANWVTIDPIGQSNACHGPEVPVWQITEDGAPFNIHVQYGAQGRSWLKGRRQAPAVEHVNTGREQHAISAASALRVDRRDPLRQSIGHFWPGPQLMRAVCMGASAYFRNVAMDVPVPSRSVPGE